MNRLNNIYRIHLKIQKLLFRGKNQSKWFVISLIILILLPIPINFFPESKKLIFEISLSLVVFTGIQLVSDTFKHFILGMTIGALAIICIWLDFLNNDSFPIAVLRPIVVMVFLLYLGYYLINFVNDNEKVNLNTISASIAGYLLLGIFGGQLCTILNLISPNSFNIIMDNQLYSLTYFSFTTLTSLGLGDVLPLTEPAKSISLLLALTGQLYITILVAILVGKYLTQKTNSN